ncbi:MAG TPA: GNAT family N-acetyltransferase [Gemmatimonadales bacterium]|nr:GNAT family N-acetyltransferase [Gemmatimonadales bacterium]
MQSRAAAFAALLLESDRRYFEAGAVVDVVTGADVAWLPGSATLAASLVVQRVRPAEVERPRQWLAAIGGAVEDRGGRFLRMYLEEAHNPIADALVALGAARSVETGLVRMLSRQDQRTASPFDVRPVRTAEDWAAKLELHRACTTGPDGHEAPAALWVAMERTRTAAGYMHPYLLWRDAEPCGTFALHSQGAFARLKNLVLRPDCRGQGHGALLTQAALDQARQAGAAAAGVFALESGPGKAMYLRAGFTPVMRQFEWTIPVAALTAPQRIQAMAAS